MTIIRIVMAGIFLTLGLGWSPFAAIAGPPVIRSAEGRSELALTSGWRFRFGGDAEGVTRPGYDDTAWDRVAVPHTWNNVGNYSLTRSPTNDTRMGIGWYRLTLYMPAMPAGRRHILQFDAVGAVAEVWVNGVRVGEHKGAYSRFRFDVTAQIRPSAANVIIVKADNSRAAQGSATEHVLPLGGDFFVHGGLYRPVSLISTDSVQIDLLDHGGPGVYITTPKVGPDRAEAEVRTRLRNFGTRGRTLSVVTTLRDARGVTVTVDRTRVRLAPGESTDLRRKLGIERPQLWNGRASPYLYQATVELMQGLRTLDRVTETFGVRTFAFDPNRGFILNGKSTPLHGASRHQDRAVRGYALTPADHAEDLAIMAEMGVNTIRHAHYQHAQDWVSEADRTGMAVWAEVPFVHESSLTDAAPTPQLIDNARTQLIELIRQNFNHPSIVTWSVGNEIDIKPALANLKGLPAVPAKSLSLLKELDKLARREDPGRPTAYADCCEATVMELKQSETLSGVTDVVGYNRYYGWYYGRPEDVGPHLDRLHALYPYSAIGVAEYGAGGAFTQHSDNPEGGPVNAFGRPHPEEYQSWVHEKTWPQFAARPYLAGSWIWNMFDFASTTREEGEATDLNDKGLVSYDRRQRKDAFYYYKAQWSSEPVLHITGRRYVDRAYPIVDVRAYSNADKATLTVNGVAIGSAPCQERICVWRNVALKPGINAVAATASMHGRTLTDQIEWTAPDAAAGLFIDSGTLTGSIASDGRRFGSDAFFVGGTSQDINAPGVGIRPGKTKAIAGTSDWAMLGSYREGRFSYDLRLPDGRWIVTLTMMEPDSSKAATRTFDVSANGKLMLRDFSPSAAAGGTRTTVTRQFIVRIRNGSLDLRFIPRRGEAVVSAITITPDGPTSR